MKSRIVPPATVADAGSRRNIGLRCRSIAWQRAPPRPVAYSRAPARERWSAADGSSRPTDSIADGRQPLRGGDRPKPSALETVSERSGLTMRTRDPSLAKGRSRMRVVAVGFALAFGSIALRLVDMAGWQPTTELSQAVMAPAANAAAVGQARSRAEIVDRNGIVLATNMRMPGVVRGSIQARRQGRGRPAARGDPARRGRQAAAAAARGERTLRPGQASHHARGAAGGAGSRSAGCRLQFRRAPRLPEGAIDQPRHGLRRRRRDRPGRHRALLRGSAACRRRAGGAQPGSAHPADRA